MTGEDKIHPCFLTEIYNVSQSNIFPTKRGLAPWQPWFGMNYHPGKSIWGEGVAKIGKQVEDIEERVGLIPGKALGANTRTLFGGKVC